MVNEGGVLLQHNLTINGLRVPLCADGGVSKSLPPLKGLSSAIILLTPWPLLPLHRRDLAVFQVKHLSISDLRQMWVVSINNNFR